MQGYTGGEEASKHRRKDGDRTLAVLSKFLLFDLP
jgi:hypothetical protein